MKVPSTASTRACDLPDDIVFLLDKHLKKQLVLCDALENIADALPESVNNQNCLHVAGSIYPIIKSAHEFEENQLFPLLTEGEAPENLAQTLTRLHEEHWEDESFSAELTEALRDFVAGRDTNTDKLAYMLRGFFEGLRRHIAFEKEALGLVASNAA
ncbi:MAG: hemerythrin domain-containing protein [Pseudomonadota bacterium]